MNAPVQPAAVIHRPAGLGHPYAASADQRVPVHPSDGDAVSLGVLAPGASAVMCEWQADGGSVRVLACAPGSAAAADAAAFVGGDGHLAEAQAEQLDAPDAWNVTSPPVRLGSRYRYRFVASCPDGDAATGWFEVAAGQWTDAPPAAASGPAGTVAAGHADAAGRADLTGHADTTAPAVTVGGLPAADHPRVVPGSVRWWVDGEGARRVRFAFRLAPGEHVVGFGERFDAVDQRGRTPDAVVFEQYKSQGATGRTYLPMPFAHVIGGDGWGFHVRTSRRTWYDVGATNPNELVVEAALAETDLVNSASGVGQEGNAPVALDVAVYDGDVREVLRAFGEEVGRAQELPDWVLRLWASGNEWNTQDIVMDRINTHRDLDIPVGVVVIEAWSDEEGIVLFRDAQYSVNTDGAPHKAADFTYPATGAWPDPKAMIDELHARGIKVILWQIPLLKTEFDLPGVAPDAQVLCDGRAMVAAGHAIREADGSAYHNRGWWFPQALMADLSTPEGRRWWTDRRRYLVAELDVDGFKTDGGEHAWGDELRYADGRRGDEGNNLNPVHYAQAFGDLLREHGKAPVTFSRAGFTGSQAHGVFWAGDENSSWEAFRWSMNAGITASACGIVYWGWDLAGFSGLVPDAELYLRGTAAATFCPVMQYHSEFNHHRRPLRDRTPWFVGEMNDDPEVVDVFRRYAALRERLVPYIAEQARVSIATGAPLMRGLFVDWPDDVAVWEHPGQFMLGADILVNPVTKPGVAEWTTYLPAGEWVDAWTGELVSGGALMSREVPRDVIPVYIRAAAWDSLREVFGAA